MVYWNVFPRVHTCQRFVEKTLWCISDSKSWPSAFLRRNKLSSSPSTAASTSSSVQPICCANTKSSLLLSHVCVTVQYHFCSSIASLLNRRRAGLLDERQPTVPSWSWISRSVGTCPRGKNQRYGKMKSFPPGGHVPTSVATVLRNTGTTLPYDFGVASTSVIFQCPQNFVFSPRNFSLSRILGL